MKFVLLLSLFFTTSAFAVDICSFEETWEFEEALEHKRIRPSKKTTNFKRFTFVEKQMVHLTVTLQDYLRGASRDEAIELFADIYQGRRGSLGGHILYYRIAGREYALVRYWPGENEFGAFYELRNRAFRLVAKITDSFIECNK